MEDDDEFGDLYTDVLHAPPPSSLHRPIDLNLTSAADGGFNHDDDDDKEILHGGSHLNTTKQTLANSSLISIPSISNSAARVLGSSKDDAVLAESAEKEVKFDIEEDIPGLSVNNFQDSRKNAAAATDVAQDDWGDEDSDSEDDLQIVLNDSNHGPMGMDRGGGGLIDDDDDGDGDPLVIVGDVDPNQGMMEEQDWGVVGEDGAAGGAVGPGVDGEKKEGGETLAGKGNVAVAGMGMPKIGYSNHGYHHPFHSQFKVSVSSVVVVVAAFC